MNESVPLVEPSFETLVLAWRSGELAARDHMVGLVYDEVKRIARRQLAQQHDATLAPTELAHEALMRVLQQTGEWQSRRHLMNVIALAVRQVLIDGARRRHAQKRDGGERMDLAEADAIEQPNTQGAIFAALEALSQTDAQSAEVINLAYFTGLDREAIADLLQVSPRTVDRKLRFGKACLKQSLLDDPADLVVG